MACRPFCVPVYKNTEPHAETLPRESPRHGYAAKQETAPAEAGAVGLGLLTPGELRQRYRAHAP